MLVIIKLTANNKKYANNVVYAADSYPQMGTNQRFKIIFINTVRIVVSGIK
jgi:hypothetical protein